MRLLVLAFLALAGALIWVRVAPSDPLRWNTDPRLEAPGGPGFLVRPLDGDIEAPFYPDPPELVMQVLSEIAAAWPRTRLLARTGQRATWITRTRVFAFPDYTTAEAVAEHGGSRLIVHARQRFGMGDWGVNEARVLDWLTELDRRLRQAEKGAKIGG